MIGPVLPLRVTHALFRCRSPSSVETPLLCFNTGPHANDILTELVVRTVV